MTRPSKNHERLERLADALVEDILAASDEEILKEAAEDFADPAREIAGIKAVFERARTKAAKNRLKAAQNAVRQDKQRESKVHLDPDAARRKLEEVLRSHPDAGTVTLAARKGQEQISDSDVLTMLEDLRELGVYKPEDDAE